jgi:hypothetical protein
MTGIRWIRSPQVLVDALDGYQRRLIAAVAELAHYFEPKLEAYAKANAPWTDRTGTARQTLFTATEIAKDMVTLYLSHGMEYGKFLELCNSGRYAIVMPTLEAHYGPIKAALDDLLR